jgi:hypothetical protein
MAINFPTSLDNFTNPVSGNTLDSPSHSLQHSDINDAVEALEAKLGIGASPAGSASAGQVLTISAAGTSTWTGIPTQGLAQLIPTSVTVTGAGGSATVGSNGLITFSAVTSLQLNGVFSSTYDHYKAIIMIDSSTSTGHGNLQYRYGTSGTPNSNTNYNNKGYYIDTTIGVLDQSGAGKISFGYLEFSPSATTGTKFSVIEIFNPFETKQTYSIAQGMGNQTRATLASVLFDLTTSFTDFYVFPNSNAINGTAFIYGFRK